MSVRTLLSALAGLVGLIRDLLAWKRSADDRKAGRDAARSEALVREADDLRASQEAVNAADARHRADPTDNAFKPRYMRDD